MIKSFSGQVVFCFAIPEPYLLMLTKTDYPSILSVLSSFAITMLCRGRESWLFYFNCLLDVMWLFDVRCRGLVCSV